MSIRGPGVDMSECQLVVRVDVLREDVPRLRSCHVREASRTHVLRTTRDALKAAFNVERLNECLRAALADATALQAEKQPDMRRAFTALQKRVVELDVDAPGGMSAIPRLESRTDYGSGLQGRRRYDGPLITLNK